ncbi:hypothetical protein U9M48_020514 [Paspalum notatum var. saurae]|uniref:Uncharacterized protein n=1 Tax=Paspalum notatum var. saurae TaxID=547442 RepID=A0AAQ3TEY9_PASNO
MWGPRVTSFFSSHLLRTCHGLPGPALLPRHDGDGGPLQFWDDYAAAPGRANGACGQPAAGWAVAAAVEGRGRWTGSASELAATRRHVIADGRAGADRAIGAGGQHDHPAAADPVRAAPGDAHPARAHPSHAVPAGTRRTAAFLPRRPDACHPRRVPSRAILHPGDASRVVPLLAGDGDARRAVRPQTDGHALAAVVRGRRGQVSVHRVVGTSSRGCPRLAARERARTRWA